MIATGRPATRGVGARRSSSNQFTVTVYLVATAPMAVHDNLQERLTMLMQEDISKKRGLVGRLLVGAAAVAVLALLLWLPGALRARRATAAN